MAALLFAAACASAGRGTGDACVPVNGDGNRVDPDLLAGRFRLTVIGENGRRVSSDLHLRPQVDSLRAVPGYADSEIHLIGSTDLNVDSVGGFVAGGVSSADPWSPGVAVIVSEGTVIVRLGSEANRRGQQALDAAFFALSVAHASESGFRGTWASGVDLRGVRGYFCASRVNE